MTLVTWHVNLPRGSWWEVPVVFCVNVRTINTKNDPWVENHHREPKDDVTLHKFQGSSHLLHPCRVFLVFGAIYRKILAVSFQPCRVCVLCDMPYPERTKHGKNYVQRTDCGNQSVFEHSEAYFKPLVQFRRSLEQLWDVFFYLRWVGVTWKKHN